MTEYFSDKELGKKQPIIEEIPKIVWNGIVAIFEEYKTNNYFSYSFPDYCYDNTSLIVGFNEEMFNDRVKAEIPNIKIPIEREQIEDRGTGFFLDTSEDENNEYVDKYSALDFVELLCRNFKTPKQKDYHSYFKHYHLSFEDDEEQKNIFVAKLNNLFERNGIVFTLGEDSQITRKVPSEFTELIRNYKTKDSTLNTLISNALEKLKSVKFDERVLALEKIWDAFERMKTYYADLKKKNSIGQLIDLASDGELEIKKELNKESIELTRIGNEFQIRHFETDKKQIKSLEIIDYLFYRMLSFINLIVTKLENDE